MILSLFVWQILMQLVYQVCYTRYHSLCHLWQIKPTLNHRKLPKYYDQNCRIPSSISFFEDWSSLIFVEVLDSMQSSLTVDLHGVFEIEGLGNNLCIDPISYRNTFFFIGIIFIKDQI